MAGFDSTKLANHIFNAMAARETGAYRLIEQSEAQLGAQRIIDSGSLWQRLKARLRKKKDKEG